MARFFVLILSLYARKLRLVLQASALRSGRYETL